MTTGYINWGNILIILALIMSIAALVPLILNALGKETSKVHTRIVYIATSALIFIAMVLLFYYFVTHDYRFLYVFNNSSLDLPLYYRIAALWAGKEGSFLLWLFILNICGLTMLLSDDKNKEIVLTVVLLTQIFLLVVLIIESPFKFIWEQFPAQFDPGQYPDNGAGLNPLLIDPWMVAHPPVLFLGYASSTIPFGYAVAALLKREYSSWLKNAYNWVIFSVISLGIGIFLGGYWAYSVLGWGGFWGWDPVENSSLIPWIIGVALMHGLILQRRKELMTRLNIFLLLFYFILVIYSTFLTRSGVLSNFSVHSFDVSAASTYIIGFMILSTGFSLALFIIRFTGIPSKKLDDKVGDWKTLTLYGIVVLVIFSCIILLGTSMPILTSVFMKKAASVDAKFYNTFSFYFGALILSLMISSTMFISSRQKEKLSNIAIALLAVAAGIVFNLPFTRSIYAYVLSAVSFFVIFHYIYDLARVRSLAILPSRLAHAGVAFLVLGVVASGYHTTKDQKMIYADQEEEVGPVRLTFHGLQKGERSTLKFSLKKGSLHREIQTAYFFSERTNSWYREPYILSALFGDVYITPEIYKSGMELATTVSLKKGEEAEIGDLHIEFLEFYTEHMTSHEPVIKAVLSVNGVKVSPGFQIHGRESRNIDEKIPGTDRTVSLIEIDATGKSAALYISPGKNTVIPPDNVIVDVSIKRLIWLVWLGTLIVSVGCIYAFIRSTRRS